MKDFVPVLMGEERCSDCAEVVVQQFSYHLWRAKLEVGPLGAALTKQPMRLPEDKDLCGEDSFSARSAVSELHQVGTALEFLDYVNISRHLVTARSKQSMKRLDVESPLPLLISSEPRVRVTCARFRNQFNDREARHRFFQLFLLTNITF